MKALRLLTPRGLPSKNAPVSVKNTSRLMSTVNEASFPTLEYKLFKLDQGPASKSTITREEALKYTEQLHTIRRMETTCGNMYKEKLIRGFCHLYSGQEAVAVGIESALKEGDGLITAYRCHAFAYTRGNTPYQVMSELAGKRTGASKGKGGSMHLYGKEFYGGNGIVGAQVPLGAGVALAMKHRKTDNVCIAMYGDGAANQGQVFEAYNMAKLWNLPTIFICENNKYGMGTAVHRASANTNYYTRGDYVPGLWVDGMCVFSVREGIRFAADWCRQGKGPILLETETYRYYGHSMSDPGTSYRTRDEVQSMRKERDPINMFVKQVTEAGLVTAEEVKAIEKKVRQSIDEASEKLRSDPEPDPSELNTEIYSKLPDNFKVRGCDAMTFSTPQR